MRITSRITGVLAATAAVTLLAAGCGSSNNSSSSSTPAAAASSGAAGGDKTACVMLPDADSSSRWENGFAAIGWKTNIQNALADVAKYATLADQQLTQGCSVMVLVDRDGAGVQVATKAHAQGVPVIAYDRPIPGADY